MKIEEVNCEKLLAQTSIEIADYVINPYKGCQYGCVYCYAKQNKSFRKSKEMWGDFVIVKKNALEMLERELERLDVKRVLIGSITEPYQQVEKKYELTRNILKILQAHHISSVILTKSDLIVRDIDILSQNKDNKICFTINTVDENIKVKFEKNSSNLEKRLSAVKILNEAGVRAYIHIGPIFPYITDVLDLMKRFRTVTSEIVLESFNLKMGQKDEIFSKVKECFPKEYDAFKDVFFLEETYYNYWNTLKEEVMALNKELGYKIHFFFRPFDQFYNQ